MEEMNKKAPAKEKKSIFSRIGHFFRSYKSETKKIVWCPWKQVRKSSAVVLAIVVAFAAVICALDFAFSWSLKNLREVVKPGTDNTVTVTPDTEGDDAAEDDAATEGSDAAEGNDAAEGDTAESDDDAKEE